MSGGLWSVVGYGDDPIPDDPGIVAAQVAHIRAVAADIKAQVDALPTDGAIDEVPWESETGAPSEFKAVCKKLPKDLDKLRTRYAKVGDAMAEFQVWLANTKGQAQDNLTIATAAHNEIVAAQAGVAQMKDFSAQAQSQASRQNAAAKPGTPPVTPAPWTGPDYGAQLSQAQATFNQARAAIDHAVTQFHQASQTAAQAVSAASNDSLQNDTSLFGSIVNAVESFGHWVANNLPLSAISGILAKIAAVAAVLSFIPVIGQIADAVILVAAIGMLACDTLTALSDAYGGTFGIDDIVSLGIDVLSLVLPDEESMKEWAEGVSKDAEAAGAHAAEADLAHQAALDEQAQLEKTLAQQSARYEKLTGGGPVKSFFVNLLGMPSRAMTGLGETSRALEVADDAEKGAAAAAASARAAAQAADRAATAATVGKNAYRGLDMATSTYPAIYGNHPTTWNPVTALYRSTTQQLSGLRHFNDDPTAQAAEETGSRLKAQPIPALAGP